MCTMPFQKYFRTWSPRYQHLEWLKQVGLSDLFCCLTCDIMILLGKHYSLWHMFLRKTLFYMTLVPKDFNWVCFMWLDFKLIKKVIFLFPSGDVQIIVKKGKDSFLFFKNNGSYHIVNTKYE